MNQQMGMFEPNLNKHCATRCSVYPYSLDWCTIGSSQGTSQSDVGTVRQKLSLHHYLSSLRTRIQGYAEKLFVSNLVHVRFHGDEGGVSGWKDAAPMEEGCVCQAALNVHQVLGCHESRRAVCLILVFVRPY